MPSFLDKLLKRKSTETASPIAPAAPSADFDTVFAKAAAAASHNPERAIQLYDQAIVLDPSRPEPYYKRANALKDRDQLDEAIAGYDQAIERKPDYAHAYCNRGFVQHRLGMLPEALASFDKTLALDPKDAFAHYNRALVMQDLSRWEDSLASYDQAIAISPDFADAQYNRAMNLLFLGRFTEGWPPYEWRWKKAQQLGLGEERNFRQPLWLGEESLQGKRLLLHSEAGLGDAIQFCRYATLCAARGASVILEVRPALLGLLSHLEGVSKVVTRGSALPEFDYHCPLLSLPLAFKTTLETIPAPQKYIHADKAKVEQWRAVLGERRRPRVGLTWSGNPDNPIDERRSTVLADWVPHLPEGLQYFRLQKDVGPQDQATLDATRSIFSVDNDLLDFTNTAALIECLDVVVTVDTSIAHLSGALGQKTWLLLPYTPDWRWMRERSDSPWYPSMRLYRQPRAGDWASVFETVAADLRREDG